MPNLHDYNLVFINKPYVIKLCTTRYSISAYDCNSQSTLNQSRYQTDTYAFHLADIIGRRGVAYNVHVCMYDMDMYMLKFYLPHIGHPLKASYLGEAFLNI